MPDTHQLAKSDIVTALRAELAHRKLDAFILPRFDAHQGEYVAPHDERLAYVTGFTGSAGMAIVTADTVAVFVDGRYSVQLRNQCGGTMFSRHHIFDNPPELWLAKVVRPGWRIGFDAMHVPPSWYDRFRSACDGRRVELLAVSDNPVDAIWSDQPPPPMGRITAFPTQFAGRSSADKIADLARHITENNAEVHVETQPDNIAWLLNMRGDDVAFNPMPHSFLIADRDGQVAWFVAGAKLESDVAASLPDSVSVFPPEAFLPTLERCVTTGNRVLVDPEFSPTAARLLLEKTGAHPLEQRSWVTRTKAVKNRTELDGMRACHLQDGIAWTEFSAWLTECVPARAAAEKPLTERDAEVMMLAMRRDRDGFLSESFHAISAAAGNAAMCHYAASEIQSAPILPDNPYLLDSGGQYETGTTDATRSFAFGARPEGYDRAYTAVFKAFHALATLRFPPGTQGHHIDAICRRPLWDLGLDYDHGTGHGVGHRLSVHEHPQRIGKPHNPVDLVPGMVLSIEPGHYVADLYGIRIENLFVIREADDGFLEFENLTLAPIQPDMLNLDHLTDAERAWINSYHRDLKTRLGPMLSPRAAEWLDRLPDL